MMVVSALTLSNAVADNQLWISAGISAHPTKHLELELEPQVRFDEDVSRFSSFLPEVSARYRIKRWLRVGAGYRLEYERDGAGELVVRHRVSTDVRLRKDIGDVRIDNRLMLMEQYRPDTGDDYRLIIRDRLGVSYRGVRPWIPYAEVEPFYKLGDLDELGYHKLRLTVGVSHDRKQHAFDLFVRAELHEDPQDPTFYILGLAYHYDL
jgi:hypothetical protein